jgi:hypothetical protein
LLTQNSTFTNNIVDGGSGEQLLTDGSLGGSDWTTFQSTLSSDYNAWWNSTATTVYFVPVPNLWTKVDFSGWKSASGKDLNSVWQAPTNPGSRCNITPYKTDYWFIMDAFSGYQTVSAGSNATFTATVVPLAFTGAVTLSSDGLQNMPGATGGWSAGTITASGSSTFTVSTTGSTPKGTYPVTLIANSGSMTRTMTVSVTVQ